MREQAVIADGDPEPGGGVEPQHHRQVCPCEEGKRGDRPRVHGDHEPQVQDGYPLRGLVHCPGFSQHGREVALHLPPSCNVARILDGLPVRLKSVKTGAGAPRHRGSGRLLR